MTYYEAVAAGISSPVDDRFIHTAKEWSSMNDKKIVWYDGESLLETDDHSFALSPEFYMVEDERLIDILNYTLRTKELILEAKNKLKMGL